MNRLAFILVVIGIWGMALFWIALEPPKTNAIVDQQIEAENDDASCGFFTKVQFEVNRLSNNLGIAHLVPVAKPLDSEACSESADVDSEEEHDPRANRISGGFQRRKVVISMLDVFLAAFF